MPPDEFDKLADQAEKRALYRDIGKPEAPRNIFRREDCARDLLAFCRTYTPNRFPLEFSDDHLRMIELLQTVILDGGQFACAMPRGSGKTTVFEAAGVWALLYGHRGFVFVVAADADAAESLCASIRNELENNDILNEDFQDSVRAVRALKGVARRAEGQVGGGERTHLVWTRNEIRLPVTAPRGGCAIHAAGITGRIRGAKAVLADGEQIRPDLVLVDDLQTDESAKSPSQVQARLDLLNGTVLGLAGPGERIACMAAVTVIERGDVADQLLDRQAHPEWQGFKAGIMHSMPSKTAQPLWDQYAEMMREDMRMERGLDRSTAFYAKHREAMDDGAKAAWPQRHAPHELSAIQHAINLRINRGDRAFFAEYMNTPLDPYASADVVQLTAAAVLKKLNGHRRDLVPLEDTTLTAGIDVQDKLLPFCVAGWGEAFGGDVVRFGTYPDQGRPYFTLQQAERTMMKAHPGASWEAALYASLDALVDQIAGQEWQRDDGSVARVDQILIDAGYGESTDLVYKFCRQSKHAAILLPSFGRAVPAGAPSLDEWKKKPGDKVGAAWRIPKPAKRQTRHCLFDANRWKTFVANRILAPMGSAASLGIYGHDAAAHRMLADQVASELRTKVTANGRTEELWTKKPTVENHAFDVLVMAAVAASIRGCKLDEKAAVVRSAPVIEAPEVPAPRPAAPPQPAPLPRTSGGWFGGYGLRR
jgi:hypothetical protein